MNAKNDLERFGVDDFLEMARVGSTDDVNVVVQFGRPTNRVPDRDARFGQWSGVKRYRIEKNLEPLANLALQSIAASAPEADMGDPRSLIDFVQWAREAYPAKKYMLIIWNHGQGWRLRLTAPERAQLARSESMPKESEYDGLRGGFRSVSSDADTGHVLYNRQIQDGLSQLLQGQKLDVIAFDACLMAMIETAYALRDVAHVMVASEELEPGSGWEYSSWLQEVVQQPQVSGRDIATLAVNAYRDHYGDDYKTTLSAVDLSGARSLATSMSSLARALRVAGTTGSQRAKLVRADIESYGDGRVQPNYVDIGFLLDRFIAGGTRDDIGKSAVSARKQLQAMVIANYRSKRVDETEGFGSTGLSIFYPVSRQSLRTDDDRSGYSRANEEWPVEFVQQFEWSCFINSHFLGATAGDTLQGCPN
jgi:hypothetical protein